MSMDAGVMNYAGYVAMILEFRSDNDFGEKKDV